MSKNIIRRSFDKMRGRGPVDPAPSSTSDRRRRDRLVNDTVTHSRDVVEQLGEQAAAELARKARAKQAKARARELEGQRGADRVPERLRDAERPTSWVVRHEPTQLPNGRWVKGLPHRNPKRAEKLAKAGTLRQDKP